LEYSLLKYLYLSLSYWNLLKRRVLELESNFFPRGKIISLRVIILFLLLDYQDFLRGGRTLISNPSRLREKGSRRLSILPEEE